MEQFVVVLAVAVCCLAFSDAFRLRREDALAAAAAEAQPAAGTDDKAAENPEDLAERYGHRRPDYTTYTNSQTYTSVNQGGVAFGGAGYGGVGYGASAGYPSGVGYSGNYGAAGYGPGYAGAGAAGYRPGYAGAGAVGYGPGYAGAGYAGSGYAGSGYAGSGYAGSGYAGSGYGGGVGTPYGAVPNVNFQSVGPNGRPAVSYESPNFGFYLRDKNAANGEGSAASAGAEAEKPKDAEAVAFGGSR